VCLTTSCCVCAAETTSAAGTMRSGTGAGHGTTGSRRQHRSSSRSSSGERGSACSSSGNSSSGSSSSSRGSSKQVTVRQGVGTSTSAVADAVTRGPVLAAAAAVEAAGSTWWEQVQQLWCGVCAWAVVPCFAMPALWNVSYNWNESGCCRVRMSAVVSCWACLAAMVAVLQVNGKACVIGSCRVISGACVLRVRVYAYVKAVLVF
jgi:hypothetical protein